MEISELSDEQLLKIIDSQLPVVIEEGDQWYYSSTTILDRDELGNYSIKRDSDERISWRDTDFTHDESEEIISSKTLTNYLRNRMFGSVESEKNFKYHLSAVLTSAVDDGILLEKISEDKW